jgi:hypothetical protein
MISRANVVRQPSPVHNNHAAHTMQEESGRNSITEYSQMSELLYYTELRVNLGTPLPCGYVCFQLFECHSWDTGQGAGGR